MVQFKQKLVKKKLPDVVGGWLLTRREGLYDGKEMPQANSDTL